MSSDEIPIPDPAIGIGAALGADMETEEAAALFSLAERPFDAATYQPRTHVPPPSGILRFEGFIPGIDEDTLLPEPMEQVIARRIGGYGSTSGPRRWYEQLPAKVRTLVDAAGFGPFCSGLIQMRAKSWLYGALVERWWDTTDLFHFSSTGEMMLTLYDFLMLIGLRIRAGGPVLFDSDMTQWRATQLQLLGVIPDTTSHGMVHYNWFLEHFFSTQPATADAVAQYARDFLIYLLGTTLFVNRENTMGLYILGALVYLPRVVEYDWGGAGLATLCCYMSSISHCKADSLGDYWRAWEVDWHPWASILQVSRTTYVAAWHASTMRILFEGPFSWAYYLGERFICQTRGVANTNIPYPLPLGMRVVDDL
ncbi:hypothetical protein ACSBR1_033357 [Camellia fascicularis]